MDLIVAFAMLILGFVPMIALVAVLIAPFVLAYRRSPKFAMKFDNALDRLFGVDEEYDAKYAPTEFTIHPSNYIRVPSR